MNKISGVDVVGFEGLYRITSEGDLFSYRAVGSHDIRSIPQIQMKGGRDADGYIVFMLTDLHGRKYTRRRARLMLDAFVGPCPNGMEACHINNNRADDRICNLRWDTHRNNIMEYGGHDVIGASGVNNHQSKLTPSEIREIRYRASLGETHSSIAKDFPVERRNITRIVNRKRWAHV